MTTLRITLALTALLIFHSTPGFAFGEISRNAPSGAPNPAAAILQQMNGTPTCLSIPDDNYDGSIGSMACGTIANTFNGTVGDVDVSFGINHSFVGDLVLKVRDPTNQRIATVMSRPGLSESVDNGSGCCGNNSDISANGVVTFNDQGGGLSAESMGASGSTVCTGDGICNYTSSPGAASTGGLSVFNGLSLSGGGNWTFCVGDAGGSDTGEFCRAGWLVTSAAGGSGSNGVINNAIASTDCVSTIVSFDLNPGTQQTTGGQTYFIAVFDDGALEFQTSVNVPFGTSSQQVQFSYPDANIGTGAPGIGLFVNTSMPANQNNNVGFVDPLNVQQETSCGVSSPQVTLTLNPNPVPAGTPFTISWNATNATGFNPCIASLGGPTGWSQTQFRPINGQETYVIDTPRNYDFAMVCESESGLLGDTSVVLTVTEPMNAPTVDFNATPDRGGPGSVIIFDWTTNISPGGLPCTPTGGAGTTWSRSGALPASGRRAVTGPMNTGAVSFGLQCSTGGQSTTDTASVTIATINNPPPPPPAVASSVTAAGTTVAGTSQRPSITADGSALTFETTAANVPAIRPDGTPHVDNNGQMDIFLKIAGNPNAVLCSIDENGPLTIGTSNAKLAPDGAGATFESDDGQIRTFEGGLGRTRGITSSAADGTPGNASSANPAIASGATIVAFDSGASNLVPNDGNAGTNDVFVKSPQTGEISLVSEGSGGAPANGESRNAAISADGSTVFFETTATNIDGLPGAATAAPAKGGGISQICGVRNPGGVGRSAGCVSVSTVNGAVGNGASRNARMSDGGDFGVFESDASNLVEGDTNGVTDVFWFNWDGSQVTGLVRVSTSKDGVQGNGPSNNPSISGDGMSVVFESAASNLDPPDANNQSDAYLKYVQSGQIVRMDSTANGQEPNGSSSNPVISGDGNTVAFGSAADNLIPGDTNEQPDIFTVDGLARVTNHSYIYFNAAEPGWGYNIQHQGDLLYGTWYTYADDGQVLFLTVEATLQPDGSFIGPVFRIAGTPFEQINNMQAFTAVTQVGTAQLSFPSEGTLMLDYTVNGVTQTKQLERFVFSQNSLTTCVGSTASRAGSDNYSDLWWNPMEAGWGLTLSHQGDLIFALWYTYGSGGRDQWVSGARMELQTDGSFSGELQRPLSGVPLAQIAGPATTFPVPVVGGASLLFNDDSTATFTYTLDGVTQSKTIQRFVVVGDQEAKPLCSSNPIAVGN